MNDILHIKGTFRYKKNSSSPSWSSLPSNKTINLNHLSKLYQNILDIIKTYNSSNNIISGALVSVYYNRVMAKSNRTSNFMSSKEYKSNQTVVGAKFSNDNKHIITHYVGFESLIQSLNDITNTINLAKEYFSEVITKEELDTKNYSIIDFKKYELSRSKFMGIIVDSYYIEKFGIEELKYEGKENAIVTFYKTELNSKEILTLLNIDISFGKIIDDTTAILASDEIKLLIDKYPHLVSMAVEDLSTYSPTNFTKEKHEEEFSIKDPLNEPTIGVIDTLFDSTVYFNKWVEYKELIDDRTTSFLDKKHGTRVTSIIVDGPRYNPSLDDGCGNFRVRHFGVARAGKSSSISIIRQIKEIITNNKDIRVWNLSLGSNKEIQKNFISVEGAELDRLQYENNIIFVIAGTNDLNNTLEQKIGAPADSINSLVVSSVDVNNNITDYSRKGPVLEFFTKPDVSYYGGTNNKPIKAYDADGLFNVYGTSYSAPWISRKLSYLIDILGFEREIAKAMIIHSAISLTNTRSHFLGHGIVPIHINDIIKTKKDEIRFVLSGTTELYETYNYRFPIPFYKNEYPFLARATLCYFPFGSRNQGVDYTDSELDIYFGRINNEERIKSLNNNIQSLNEGPVTEEISRKNFGKWDNVKHIQDDFVLNPKGRIVYDSKRWGMKIVSKDRLGIKDKESIRFGVVVTLKEINGVNRIDDFIHMFSLNGWIVNRISVENRIDIYEKAEEVIEFD